jgi:hypothetical protein
MTLVFLAGSGGFALAALWWFLAPGRSRLPTLAVVVASVVVGAVGALTASSESTAWGVADSVWRVVLGGLAGGLGVFAAPATVALVLFVLAAGASGGWAAAAAATAGAQVATAVNDRQSQLVGGLAGAAAASAALRLERPADPYPAAVLAVGALVVVMASGLRGMPPSARRPLYRWGRLVALAIGAFAALGGFSVLLARPRIERGAVLAERALASARAGETTKAEDELARASSSFRGATSALDGWWARPARGLPFLGPNLEAALVLTRSGRDLSAVGATAMGAADADSIRMANGVVDLRRLTALQQPVRRSASALLAAEARIDGVRTTWLFGPIARRRTQVAAEVETARRDATRAVQITDALPAMLGGSGPRRYFLAVVTPSELRGSGGIIGNYGELVADGGRLSLTRLGRIGELNDAATRPRKITGPPEYLSIYERYQPNVFFQNVTASPDFPTVARVIGELYPQSGGSPVDGVISVDPIMLADLLRLIGPVDVAGLDGPLTADNAAEELLHTQYVRLPNPERVDFLGDAARAVFERLVSVTLPGPAKLAQALAPAVDGRHLQIVSLHPEEQAVLDLVGASGRVPGVDGDSIGVVTQNAGPNKIDWFLDRSYEYDVRVDPRSGALQATLDVHLRNRAPASGLPAYVIGPVPGDVAGKAGQNRLLLSIYTPWSFDGATLEGKPVLLESGQMELGRRVYSVLVEVPAGATADFRIALSGSYPAGAPAYRLDVAQQPTARPDRVSVKVAASSGSGSERQDFDLDRPRHVIVGLRSVAPAGVQRD